MTRARAIFLTTLALVAFAGDSAVERAVPVIAALGGVALLGEAITPRLVLASAAILGGIALVSFDRR